MNGTERLSFKKAKSNRATWIFAAALPLMVAAWSTPAYADDEAVTRFERGVQLYEAENYEGALVEFNTAYKLSKNYKLLYNVGICQNAMKDYAAATESFQRYLNEGGAELSEARRADVNDRLSKLSLMVTRVRVSTNAPSGATLLIDEQPSGTTPLPDTIPVKIGRRQFSITAQGRTVTKTVDVSSGDQTPISLVLTDTPGQANDTTSTPVSTDDDGPSFPWPFWGLTAVLGGATAVTGVLAVGKANDFEKKQATFGIDKASLEDERSKAQTLGLVTDVLLVCTVLSAGVSTVLTIRYFGKKKQNTGIIILPLGIGYSRSF
jgi:hypothetical protein